MIVCPDVRFLDYDASELLLLSCSMAATTVTPHSTSLRTPSFAQKLSCATYVYLIPVALLLNVLCLCNTYTFCVWLIWTVYINFGPGKWACKKATWPKPLRRWTWWRHCAEYFPTQLIKTADLDPDGRYIFVVAPHGILTMFCWPCFDTDPTGFSTKFPGIDIHPMTLELNFRMPFLREFLLLHGIVDASKTACLMVLGKGSGQAILLAVGGAQEAMLSRPGTYDLVLAKRKGFVRIALQTGAKLVPVIGFGEPDLYDVKESGTLRLQLTKWTKKLFGFTLPNPVGQGLFWGTGIMPYARPLNVVVGAPLEFDCSKVLRDNPEGANLDAFADAYHEQYMAALKQLWDTHKDKYAQDRRKSLEIVE